MSEFRKIRPHHVRRNKPQWFWFHRLDGDPGGWGWQPALVFRKGDRRLYVDAFDAMSEERYSSVDGEFGDAIRSCVHPLRQSETADA